MRKILSFSASAAAMTALSACGGGGGVNSTGSPIVLSGGGGGGNGGTLVLTPPPAPAPVPTPTPSPTPTPDPIGGGPSYSAPVLPAPGQVITTSNKQPKRSLNDTAEFRRNYSGTEFVNALYALDGGHSGKAVVVGVIDDGVVNVGGELNGRISPLSKDFGKVTSNGIATQRNVIGDQYSDHGTAVANVIGAAANGTGTVGYAPDVTIVALRVSDWDEDTKTETFLRSIQALDYAGDQGIRVVNMSLSGKGSAVLGSAMTRYGATGGLLINSAGNDSGADPNDAGSVNATNRSAVIFVGALSSSISGYMLESYSNKAGVMKDRYVVAPGSNVTTRLEGDVSVFAGTSSAAPVVTGLAATILSKWPQLTGQQAGDVILNTAKDIGAVGVDEVFGRGLVDFKAALSPVNPTLSNGVAQTSIQTSAMGVPSAMGVAQLQNALTNVTVLDAYGRDFSGSIAQMIIRPEEKQGHWLRRRIGQIGSGGQTELAGRGFSAKLGYATYQRSPREGDVSSALTTGSVSYSSGRTSFRAGWNAAESIQSDLMGLAPFADGVLAYAPQAANSFGVERLVGGSRIGLTVSGGHYENMSARAATLSWARHNTELRASFVDETNSIMGTPTGSGALRLGSGASTLMFEAHRTFDLSGGWHLEGYGSIGVTRIKIDRASLVTGASSILGTRLGIQASRPAFGGLLSLGLAQPLMIENGSAHLTYASGYDLASRSLLYGSTDASLAGDRRLQMTAGFSRQGNRSSLRIGVMRDLSDGSTRALAGWRLRL